MPLRELLDDAYRYHSTAIMLIDNSTGKADVSLAEQYEAIAQAMLSIASDKFKKMPQDWRSDIDYPPDKYIRDLKNCKERMHFNHDLCVYQRERLNFETGKWEVIPPSSLCDGPK